MSLVFRRLVFFAGCCAALVAPTLARAQAPGELDTTFTSAIVGATFYTLTLEKIGTDTRIFVGGDLGVYQRLDATGAVDQSFALPDFGLSLQRIIYTSALDTGVSGLAGPKLLLAGLFGRDAAQIVAKESAQNIKRFLADGSIDPAFNPGTGTNGYVTALLPLADGSIIVGGEFDQFNKVAHPHIVKLDNSGAVVDGSIFNSALAFDSTVLSLAQQYANDGSKTVNGQILVAGTFSSVNGQTHTKLARINPDGTVDASFNPVFSDRVRVVVSTTDGKILAGGDFETVNNTALKHLVRLNYDGSVDTAFNALVTTMPPGIAAPVAVNTITPIDNGRYYIGGNFYKVNGVDRHYLARVLTDGTVDDFDPGDTLSNTVQQVVVDKLSNRVYVTQTRDKSVNGVYPASIFRLYGDAVPAPSVTVTAPVATATRKQSGEFLFTRVAVDTEDPLTVSVSVVGTAQLKPAQGSPGDYQFTPALTKADKVNGQKRFSVTFPANEDTVAVFVRPSKTSTGLSSVVAAVQPDPTGADTYTVGSAGSATVLINRPVPAPSVKSGEPVAH